MSSDTSHDEFVIAHATDLLPDGQTTFDHAFALARDGDGRVISLHVNEADLEGEAPEARQMLERLSETQLDVEHDIRVWEDVEAPNEALVREVQNIDPDLLVVGTRQQSGSTRRFGRSVSEEVALEPGVPTLVVHIGMQGVVAGNGQLMLNRILVAVGDESEAGQTVDALSGLLDRVGVDDVDIFMVRVGDDDILDRLSVPDRDGWRWHRERHQGSVKRIVAELCDQKEIDLIAMGTRGRDGVFDIVSGTHTQKIIRRAPRPVFAVPVRSQYS